MARRENDVPTNSTASPALEQLQIEVKQRSGQTKTFVEEKEVKVQTPELKQVGGGTVDASTQTDVDASTQTDVDASTQTDMDTSTQTAVGTYNWKQVHFTSIALLALCVAPFYLKSNKDNSPGNIVSGLIMYHVLKPFFETFGDKVVKVVEQIYK